MKVLLITPYIETQNEIRTHQSGSVIKPYSLSINELQEWREKFIDIRFKYMKKI